MQNQLRETCKKWNLKFVVCYLESTISWMHMYGLLLLIIMPVFTLNVSLSSGCITKRTSFRLVLGLSSMYWAIARHAFLDATFFGNLWNPVVRPGKAIEESFWLSSSFRHLDMNSMWTCNCNRYLIHINQYTSAVTFNLLDVSAIPETTSFQSYNSASSLLIFFSGRSIDCWQKTKTNLFCVIWSIFLETPVAGGFTSKISRSSYCNITLSYSCGVLLVTLTQSVARSPRLPTTLATPFHAVALTYLMYCSQWRQP